MSTNNFSDLHVLIVDNFHNFRTVLTKNMHAMGFRMIRSVASGNEAISACQNKHYDVILSDYNLGPGKSGQQLLEELQFLGLLKKPDIFVLISADTSRDVIMASYDCEPSDYITKPVTGKTLEQRLTRLLIRREELIEIYRAIDQQNYSQAITLLETYLATPSRYSMDCQKLLGELYLKEEKYSLAQHLYQQILQVRQLDWALVGLANVALAQDDTKEAIHQLEQIVNDHPACLKAYDSLFAACTVIDDKDRLQKILERAVAVSPLSIKRQKILADVALDNGDAEVAIKAYKKTIKYAEHSHYDSVDNHLNFARSLTKIYDDNIEKAHDMSLDASKYLDALGDNYTPSNAQKIQAKLLNSQVNALRGNTRACNDLLMEAKNLITANEQRDIDIDVDAVNALILSGKKKEAEAYIEDMLNVYKNDQAALEKIDPLLDEPVSKSGIKMIEVINRKGIDLYQMGDFSQAVDYFFRAQRKFPHYMGLKLNLIQAMLGDMKANGINDDYISLCATSFENIKKQLPPGSDKHSRYLQLNSMYHDIIKQKKLQNNN